MHSARYEKWSSVVITPLIEERKSFEAELNEKPIVEFVEQTPQLLNRVKDLSSTTIPQVIEED